MRIGANLFNSSVPNGTKKIGVKSANGFQGTLEDEVIAQKTRSKDTMIISSAANPAVEVKLTSMQDSEIYSMVSRPDVYSTDSTEVKLEKLRTITQSIDYTGMTDTEIYKTIWNIYNNAFDGNMPAIQIGAFPGAASTALRGGGRKVGIIEQFQSEIRKLGVNSGEAIDSAYDFTGLSLNERESLIIEKYKGKNTTLDFLNMTGELWTSGVLIHKLGEEGAYIYKDIATRGLLSSVDSFPIKFSENEWSSGANSKIDVTSYLRSAFDAFCALNPNLTETFDPIDFFIQKYSEEWVKMQDA